MVLVYRQLQFCGPYQASFSLNFPSQIFVTAIGTNSGKTFISALLAQRLGATYWKPIQSGSPTDSAQIREWLGQDWPIWSEAFRLKEPASPHFAAAKEGLHIQISDVKMPIINGPLVVEGAGGLLVPINESETMADLIRHLKLPLVLVIDHYLGAINHSLLTIQEIKRRGLIIAGIVFNGEDFQGAEPILEKAAQAPVLLRLPRLAEVNSQALTHWSEKISLPNA